MIYQHYRTGFVQRYAQNPEMAWTGQTLGQHQWGVVTLLKGLFRDEVTVEMLWEAHNHDTGEMGACDASYPAKMKHPGMAAAISEAEAEERAALGVPEADLTPHQHRMLKLCDRLESLLFAKIRAPWVLDGAGWPELCAKIVEDAEALGVGPEVKALLHEALGVMP